MKIRRILALMLVLAFAACLFAGCSNDKNTPSDDPSTSAPNSSSDSAPVSGDVENKRVVLLVKKLSSSYWTDLADAVQKQCDEYGWKLDVLCPVTADSNEEQIELLQQSLLDPPDVYLIAPADASGIAPAIEEINDAGIPIICVTNKIAEGCGDYVTYVGVQYYDIAATAASALVEHLGGNGKILFIEGTTGSSTSIDINDGAKSVFNAEAGIELIGFGIAFELPLFVFYLAVFHIVPYVTFRAAWRYIYVAMAVIAATVTPDANPVTMIFMYAVLLSLYELSLFVTRFVIIAREGKAGLKGSRVGFFAADEEA